MSNRAAPGHHPIDEGGGVAPFGRRFFALLIDWVACLLVARGVIGRLVELGPEAASFLPLGILFLINVIGITLGGGTLGHRMLGLRVVPLVGEWVTPPRAAIRAALLCLALPPIIVLGDDGRGLHDRAAKTTIIRA